MRPPKLTIEYKVGEGTVRRRLSEGWPCPLCTTPLEPAGDRPLGLSKLLECPACKEQFRVVEVEMPPKPKNIFVRRTPPPKGTKKRS